MIKQTLLFCSLGMSLVACGAEPPAAEAEMEATASKQQKLEDCTGLDDNEAIFCHIKQISEVASTV